MRKIICLMAVVGLTVAWAAPAQAGNHNRTASHDINSTIKLAGVESTGSPPLSGSAEYAGTFKGALGSGAIVGTNFFGPVPDFHGNFRVYLNRGTLKGALEGSGAPTSAGLDVSGDGVITRGTGKYKGAHGKFTFAGSQPAASPVTTLAITGSVKY